ncbi:ISXO2 transposase-like protein [Pseudoduganella lurida]|uniref:ISXO2 transposase-like protein n=1 Tax=Pseudoduganella lurida TaxID=1036180 RepID=A0A562RLJ4_9BURK|nr:IS1595 family transposase [Pseudoduganella lurida]TWI69901.1 ISXO2 transposase-like protein [Pseudoduganella lurida]
MNDGGFIHFLTHVKQQLERLTAAQLATLQASLVPATMLAACLQLIEQHGNDCRICPHCKHPRTYRHGFSYGLQRYRCCACHRTFNKLTNTPLAYLRLRGKWLSFLQCLLDAVTVRAAADKVAIHRNTSFRWRHRFLQWAKDDRPARLQGIVEADETYLLESQKGSRHLTRPARRRGGKARGRGISRELDCILVARDRGGRTRDFVCGRGPVTAQQLHQYLGPILPEDVMLVTDSAAAYRAFASAAGLRHETVNLRAGVRVRDAVHLQNINGYHGRFHRWLARFNGVASHYLPNYLGWRHGLEGARWATPADCLVAALGHNTVESG